MQKGYKTRKSATAAKADIANNALLVGHTPSQQMGTHNTATHKS